MTSVRKAAPRPLKQAGRRLYIRVGTTTAPLRLQPAFIMIGAQRCGTTSLFRALMAHPQVVRPAFHKGVNYFDLNYYRGMRWYRGHFPIAEIARRRTPGPGDPVAFEASGYYMYHPFATERIARELPGVKLVVMLRDPVERAFSAYKHEYARGYEWETFDRALELEDERLVGEIERMRRDPAYESFPHRHHSYRHRGQYADQLDRVYQRFPRSQVHIIESEALFDQAGPEYQRLLSFLGLQPFEPARFDRYNARPGAPLEARTRKLLEEHYRPHDERLAGLLGRPPVWAR
jgi:sulfotransferase family protein